MLRVLTTRSLCAPNLWHSRAVQYVELAAEPVNDSHLVALIQQLRGRAPLAFPEETPHVPSAAHALMHIAILLQQHHDPSIEFGRVIHGKFPHLWIVVFETEDAESGSATLEAACRMIECLPEGSESRLNEIRYDYDQFVSKHRLGGRTRHLFRAARDRGIPVLRIDRESLLQLGQGIHRQRLLTAITDRTSLLAETISRDKETSRQLFSKVGLPVVEGIVAIDPEAAIRFAEDLGLPVVVKPRDADYGNGVTLNLSDPAEIRSAWRTARQFSEDVLVERYHTGDWHRVLVVGNRIVAAVRRMAPKIKGNGQRTVHELIDDLNSDPRRGTGYDFPMEPLRITAIELAMLFRQGYGLDSILPSGVEVALREDAYLATGASQVDVTDRIHPEAAAIVLEATALIGLDVAGIDLISTDLSKPLKEQSIAILEVNAEPAFTIHLSPFCIPSRPVPSAILESLFPAGQTGRIPLVAFFAEAIMASATATPLQQLHPMTAFVTSQSWKLGPRLRSYKQHSLSENLKAVWMHPGCTSTIVSIDRNDIETEGLPFDRCDMLVIPVDSDQIDESILKLLLSTNPEIVITHGSIASRLADVIIENNQPQIVLIPVESNGDDVHSSTHWTRVTRIENQIRLEQNGVITDSWQVAPHADLRQNVVNWFVERVLDRAFHSLVVPNND